MTNYEYLVKNKQEIAKKALVCGGIAKVNGEITLCSAEINCNKCDFDRDKNNKKTCNENIREWLDEEYIVKLLPCPFCGKEIDTETDMYIPERDWKPTFYDPDSGGDPVKISCKCGLEFSTGTYEYKEFVEAWNRRA